jgi:hypothetical protein
MRRGAEISTGAALASSWQAAAASVILVSAIDRREPLPMRLVLAAALLLVSLLVSLLVFGPTLVVAGPALAQHHHERSAYAGLETRDIKALSAQQLADLQAGRGMGLAIAAELNGYPGPLHVFELADSLGLSPD